VYIGWIIFVHVRISNARMLSNYRPNMFDKLRIFRCAVFEKLQKILVILEKITFFSGMDIICPIIVDVNIIKAYS